ncbi:hypothetical protein [Paraburkholderia sp.]|uniref:hypothetical protein n=1 Tax=Paraburkholderia sp. TaxID=1926495 RepID=UPI002F412E9A
MTRKSDRPSQATRTRPGPLDTLDARLDEALMESFPASDPIAVDIADPHRARIRKATAENRKRQ